MDDQPSHRCIRSHGGSGKASRCLPHVPELDKVLSQEASQKRPRHQSPPNLPNHATGCHPHSRGLLDNDYSQHRTFLRPANGRGKFLLHANMSRIPLRQRAIQTRMWVQFCASPCLPDRRACASCRPALCDSLWDADNPRLSIHPAGEACH